MDQDDQKIDEYFAHVYTELKKIARQKLKYERKLNTFNTTALVHEAYLKLAKQDKSTFQDERHFLAIASQAMRRILIDYARYQQRHKRGGDKLKITHDDASMLMQTSADELLSLNEALKKLGMLNKRQSRIIECWFFGGFNHEEIAHMLDISVSSVRRDWRLARVWLSKELKQEYNLGT